MNGNSHPWSSDPEGQAAIRRAEPDRGPTLAHHEVPAMVEKLGASVVAAASSLAKAYHDMAEALYRVNDRVARLEGWIDNRRADATSMAEAYAVAARQAEAAARDHTSTFVMPDPMRSAPEGPVEWRILKAEETILEGDQYQGQGQWFETNAAGTRLPVGHPVTYRRRVKSAATPAANAGGEANNPHEPESLPEHLAYMMAGPFEKRVFLTREEVYAYRRSLTEIEAASMIFVPLCAAPQPPRGWLTEEDCAALYLARAVLDGVFVGSWQEKHDAARRLVSIRERAKREAGGEVTS